MATGADPPSRAPDSARQQVRLRRFLLASAFSVLYLVVLGIFRFHDGIDGATLLHVCADYDELEIAGWLLDRGMDVDARATVDADGFGGHTALFGTVVSQPNFWINRRDAPPTAPFTQLLLDRGADPNVRASLRKQLHPGYGPEPDTMHEYRDVTPLAWGERFHRKEFVNEAALEMLRARGGRR